MRAMKAELDESLNRLHADGPWRGAEAQLSTHGGPSEAGEVNGSSILGQDGDRVLRREWRLAAGG
jgi:hypothetical protein